MAKGKSAKLAAPKGGYWKARGKNGEERLIPFNELSDDHLQKAYYVTQNKELESSNKAVLFYELRMKLEEEAKRRGVPLRSIEETHHIGKYFANERKLKKQ